jgi:V8-like Glu-specific endopeptidase
MFKNLVLSILLIAGITHAATGGDVRSFELDGSTRYVRGRFDMETEDGAILTTPTKPTKPRGEAVGVYAGRPRSMQESFLIEGEDGRERIMDTAKFPWCVHGQMTWKFGGETLGGSGVLVGPHHFLTAAHNVYRSDRLEQAKNIKIRLGLNDDAAMFGEVHGTKVYLYDQWMRSGNHEYDIALVILNRSIGLETGWAGLLCLEDKELKEHKVHVSGYPGDKGLKTLWTMEDTISRVTASKLHYLIDTYKGQSGGAIWIKKWGMPHVLGTHAYEGGIMDGGNYGVRLSESKIKTIVGWIRDTLVIDEPAPVVVAAPPSTGSRYGGGGSASAPSRPLSSIPLVARGHEEAYRQFLNGVLVYKPNADGRGKIELPIRALANPLEGTFDLSRCGDTGKYLSINTGYKKAKIPANKKKTEIWLMPKFLVEANIGGDASWLSGVMSAFDAPYGIVWTNGRWDVDDDNFDYLLSGDVLLDKSKNLCEKWSSSASPARPSYSLHACVHEQVRARARPVVVLFFKI